jgi:hypothetical protein
MTAERFEVFLAARCSISGCEDRSWREWMTDTFTLLIDEADDFSGKRPGCDSGWISALAEACGAHVDPAIVDEDGDIDWALLTVRFRELLVYAFAPRG